MGTLAAVCEYAMVPNSAVLRGFGEMAEWFKAAVLKTAIREHPDAAGNRQTLVKPSRITRVPHPFARNTQAQETAQEVV